MRNETWCFDRIVRRRSQSVTGRKFKTKRFISFSTMSQAAAQQVQKQYESYIETLKSLQTSIQSDQQKFQV
jgi:hypothetical protein